VRHVGPKNGHLALYIQPLTLLRAHQEPDLHLPHPVVLVSVLPVRMTVPPAEVQPRGAEARVEQAEHMDRASTERAAHERDEGASHSGERPCDDDGNPRWLLRTARGEFVLTSSVVLGRALGCDLQVDDDSVSRRHAFLRVERDAVWVDDLSSRNGTWVNGVQITEATRLAHGDKIGVGTCEFALCAAAALDGSRVTQPVIPLVPSSPLSAPIANDLDNKSVAPDGVSELPGGPSLSALSPRERAVFPLLASGLSQREIASQCGVTVKTIETYRTRIGHKLGLSTRAEFIRFALEIGVLRPSRANVPGQATDAAG
jgi:DNA-binding CsgD family transcriptional regulator